MTVQQQCNSIAPHLVQCGLVQCPRRLPGQRHLQRVVMVTVMVMTVMVMVMVVMVIP
jgi:hypothetical protein